jgi:hypothetical protein
VKKHIALPEHKEYNSLSSKKEITTKWRFRSLHLDLYFFLKDNYSQKWEGKIIFSQELPQNTELPIEQTGAVTIFLNPSNQELTKS